MPSRSRVSAVLAWCCLAGTGTGTGAVAASAASGGTSRPPAMRVNVPHATRGVLPRLERTSGVPIRIPRTVYFSTRSRVYETGTATVDGYDIELGFAPACGGADACFAASFTGRRGRRPVAAGNVRLAGGIVGRFTPSSCGGSCAPPQIEWFENGVSYTLQLYGGRPPSDEAGLVGYADSAITQPRL
jgi:hypothetical protein